MKLGNDTAQPVDSLLLNVLLDRSGSMEPYRPAVINGFNKLKEEQTNQPADTWITLSQFNNGYQEDYVGKVIAQVQDLTMQSYVPSGATALLDAVARSIASVETWIATVSNKPKKVLFAIYTDGYENASVEFTKPKLAELMDAKRRGGWEFVFLGADQDAWANASAWGVAAKGNTLSYNKAQTMDSFTTLSSATTNYRRAAVSNNVTDFFAQPDDSDTTSEVPSE